MHAVCPARNFTPKNNKKAVLSQETAVQWGDAYTESLHLILCQRSDQKEH